MGCVRAIPSQTVRVLVSQASGCPSTARCACASSTSVTWTTTTTSTWVRSCVSRAHLRCFNVSLVCICTASLQTAVRVVQEGINRYEGTIARLLCDDKGTRSAAQRALSLIPPLHRAVRVWCSCGFRFKLAFGMPTLSHEDDSTRAVLACIQVCRRSLSLAGLALHMVVASFSKIVCRFRRTCERWACRRPSVSSIRYHEPQSAPQPQLAPSTHASNTPPLLP